MNEESQRQTNIITDFDAIYIFMGDLMQLHQDTKRPIILISFNGSRFDDIFVKRAALEYELHINGIFAANSVISLQVGGFITCWDLSRFLVGASLKTLCDNFKTDIKKVDGYNHYEIQKRFETLGTE